MHRLANAHRGERAVVVFGGPSLLSPDLDLGRLARLDCALFLETKALTQRYLDFGLRTDYFLMFYPEKAKSHSLHMAALQSDQAGFDLRPLVREERLGEIGHLLDNRDSYFTIGKANITHKRLRWRPDVFLPASPFSLLPKLSEARLITFRPAYREAVRHQVFSQSLHGFDLAEGEADRSLASYYAPEIRDDGLYVRASAYSNSAAIALYPLLKFMGFSRVYFMGSDMTMLGSMEHAAPFTFRSMNHFRVFYNRARRAFGTHFPVSDRSDAIDDVRARWWEDGPKAVASSHFRSAVWAALTGKAPFLRPRKEMRDAGRLMRGAPNIEFVNVYSDRCFSQPAEGIRNITFSQLFQE